MCGPDRMLFRPLRFSNGPFFLFENWFRYRSHFGKMHNFRWIFPFSLPIGCLKVLMHYNLCGKKYWLVLKRVLQEANGLVIGCNLRLLWFSYRVVVETSGRTSVPNPKLSTPRVLTLSLSLKGAYLSRLPMIRVVRLLSRSPRKACTSPSITQYPKSGGRLHKATSQGTAQGTALGQGSWPKQT